MTNQNQKVQKVQTQTNLNQKIDLQIDDIYLTHAYNIRLKYENIHKLLDNKQKNIKNLKESINSLKTELVKAKKDIQSGDKTIMDKVYKILNSLEEETQKLSKIINPVEEKMEELRKDENVLYTTLKEKYPHYEDKDLKNSIINYISKRKRDQ